MATSKQGKKKTTRKTSKTTRPRAAKPRRKKPSSPKTDPRITTVLEHIDPEFIVDSARKVSEADLGRVVARSDTIARKFAKGTPLDRFGRDARVMLSIAKDYDAGKYRAIPYWSIAVITFGLSYVRKPVDIIPDSLPVIGQLDDAVVFSHCKAMVKRDILQYKMWKLGRKRK